MSQELKVGSNYWDAIHEKLNGQKRDTAVCPSSYSLCASSLGGGCCPTDYSCGVSGCYAPATTTTTGCSTGSTTCGIVQGGGCCPSGHSCERNGCIAPTGSSASLFCSANSYLCPASLNYGCCRNGLSCGLSTCHETTSTTTVSVTLILTTTNSNSAVTTITTVVETVYNPSESVPGSITPVPTPIAKLPTITSSPPTSETSYISKPSPGISGKELGGIVGACVFLLLVLLAATYFILRRLNLTIKLTKVDRTTNHPGGSNPSSSRNLRLQSLGIDPLQQIPSSRTGTQSHQPRTNQTTPSELSDNTPFNNPRVRTLNSHSSRGPPLVPFSSLNWSAKATSRSGNAISSVTSGAYRSLPSSDGSRHWRNDSEGSQTHSISNPTTTATMNGFTAELQTHDPQGYFDIPIPKTAAAMVGASIDPAMRDQNLRFGRVASTSYPSGKRPSIEETRGGHGRQWSDVSELSNGTETTNESYELDDTSPRPSYSKRFGSSKSTGYGLYGSANNNDKRSLRDGVKDRVQGWVGMTSLGRKNSRRKDDGLGSARGIGLGGFKTIPSPTQASPPSSSPSIQDQEQWLRGMEPPPLPSFTRFGEKGRLEAIREALRESGTTMSSNSEPKSDSGGVSESRAQIARMELKRADSDLTLLMGGDEDVGESGFKDLIP